MSGSGPSLELERLRFPTGTLSRLRLLSHIAGLIVILAGGLVLLGWTLNAPWLCALLPGSGAMNPLTALSFGLSGLALWALVRGELGDSRLELFGRICASLVLAIGLWRLFAYLGQWSVSPDQLLFADKIPTAWPPGRCRMKPNTALNFALSGLGLLWLRVEGRRGIRPGQLLLLLTTLVALTAIIGYAYRALALYGLRSYLPLALNTALCFLVLCLGGLCAYPDRGVMAILTSDSAGGVLVRRLLPAVIFIPLALGALRLWGQQARLYDTETGVALFAVACMALFAGTIWWTARLLHRADRDRTRAERRLAVQYTVGRVLAEAPSLAEAVPSLLKAVAESLDWPVAAMWEVDPRSNSLNCVEAWQAPGANAADFAATTRQATFPPGIDLPGRIWASGQPVWIRDVARDPGFVRAPVAAKAGLHGAFGFPIRLGREVVGVMEFFSHEVQPPDPDLPETLTTIGSQVGQFVEARRAEAALRDSEALYRSLVDTLPINILRKDAHGHITFANRSCCATLGKRLADLLGKTDFDLFPRTLAEKYIADDQQVMAARQILEDVELHQRLDGELVYMQILKAAVVDARDKVIGTQVLFWDVTARKKAEDALGRIAADLARSNRELEQFAYVASHDLQEPLRMIASYTQLLARRYKGQLDQDAQEFIGYAVDGAIRMQQLINDLLTFSRLGIKSKPFQSVSCEEVFQAAAENLKIAIEESGAVITHEPLPAVQGDFVQLIQLFQNLLSNAIKFRGQAPPQIHLAVQQRPRPAPAALGASSPHAGVRHAPAEEWVICVGDNGIGIDPKYFTRIFDIFARLHTRNEYPGTGIGLAACKKIVERHNGRIWVESELGRGAKFFFTLPL